MLTGETPPARAERRRQAAAENGAPRAVADFEATLQGGLGEHDHSLEVVGTIAGLAGPEVKGRVGSPGAFRERESEGQDGEAAAEHAA